MPRIARRGGKKGQRNGKWAIRWVLGFARDEKGSTSRGCDRSLGSKTQEKREGSGKPMDQIVIPYWNQKVYKSVSSKRGYRIGGTMGELREKKR